MGETLHGHCIPRLGHARLAHSLARDFTEVPFGIPPVRSHSLRFYWPIYLSSGAKLGFANTSKEIYLRPHHSSDSKHHDGPRWTSVGDVSPQFGPSPIWTQRTTCHENGGSPACSASTSGAGGRQHHCPAHVSSGEGCPGGGGTFHLDLTSVIFVSERSRRRRGPETTTR